MNLIEIIKLSETHPLVKSDNLKSYCLEFENLIELLITIGGDGTILFGMTYFQNRISPVTLSFEKGNLGFMCMFSMDNFTQKIHTTMKTIQEDKEFVVEKRIRIYGELLTEDLQFKQGFHALNEFVVTRGKDPHVLRLNIFINDIFLTELHGDGLIVSTPGGSIAYGLSAGGPIVQNEVGSIIIVPICPLSLSFRPLVLPICMKVRIQLSDQSRGTAVISADGQVTFPLGKKQSFTMTHSTQDVKLIVPFAEVQFNHWVKKLKYRLNWNNKFQTIPKEELANNEHVQSMQHTQKL